MSFAQIVKEEIVRMTSSRPEEISELSALIKNTAILDNDITIHLENNLLARKIYKIIKEIYGIKPRITVRQRYNFTNQLSYIISIKTNYKNILNDIGLLNDNQEILNIPKKYIYADEELIRAYLRGIFLSTGSINDPKTSRYHMQIIVKDLEYAQFIQKLISRFNINVKVIPKDKNYMIYLKEAEKISDFLRVIKAYNAVLYFEDIRIYRDHKNMTNRLNNCEQANMDKVFLTSMSQIKMIEKIKKLPLYNSLDEKLKIVMEYRTKYPESSLSELSEIINNKENIKITKSGLNHRFRKIKEILNTYENK